MVENDSASRRERLIDAVIVLAVFAILLLDGELSEHGGGISLLGIVGAIGASAPLFWRRRAPVWVLVAVTPFVFVVNATLQPYDWVILVPSVAVFSVALYGDRRRSLEVAAVMVPLVVIGVGITKADFFSDITVENLAWVLLALVAGDALRSRQAAASDLIQRRESEQREREADAERRMADERLQIAREVHDVVAHSMVAINVQAGTAAHLIESHPEQAEGALREIKRVSGAALTDLRATLSVLRDEQAAAPTQPVCRLLQLSDLVEPLRASGVEVDVDVSDAAAEVPSTAATAAYRIVQEALTNVVRHAGARHAAVRVGVGGEVLDVEVLDDGSGADGLGEDGGNGLRGMRERAAAIGGVVEAGQRPGGGWRVHATLPLRTS